MKWQKLISTILHPVVTPTIGILLFFIINNFKLNKNQQLLILSIVFIATYVIPILLLVILKSLGLIKSFKVKTIKERKIPLIFMTALFILLGKAFLNILIIRDFSLLFFGTALALTIVYFLFKFRLKSSLHLLSMGSATAFFLTLSIELNYNPKILISILFLLSGFLAKARLDLKAHTFKEVFLGFFIGFFSQFITYYLL